MGIVLLVVLGYTKTVRKPRVRVILRNTIVKRENTKQKTRKEEKRRKKYRKSKKTWGKVIEVEVKVKVRVVERI